MIKTALIMQSQPQHGEQGRPFKLPCVQLDPAVQAQLAHIQAGVNAVLENQKREQDRRRESQQKEVSTLFCRHCVQQVARGIAETVPLVVGVRGGPHLVLKFQVGIRNGSGVNVDQDAYKRLSKRLGKSSRWTSTNHAIYKESSLEGGEKSLDLDGRHSRWTTNTRYVYKCVDVETSPKGPYSKQSYRCTSTAHYLPYAQYSSWPCSQFGSGQSAPALPRTKAD